MKEFDNNLNIEDVEIYLSRGMCFGNCPVYSLLITGNGDLIYTGEYYVKVKGVVKTKISPDKVLKIIKRSFEIDFFNLKDEYLGEKLIVTDLPLYTISIKIKDKIKTVYDYLESPAKLRSFEDFIDKICESHKWIGSPKESDF